MRYIVKVVHLCPEGAVVGTDFWIATCEAQMELMLKMGSDYRVITCLGPETEMSYTLKNKLKKIEQAGAGDCSETAPRNP